MNKNNCANNDLESQNTISIICPSSKGKDIAFKLKKHFNGMLYIKQGKCLDLKVTETANEKERDDYNSKIKEFDCNEFSLNNITKKAMKNSKGVIFVSSTGIAVRAIAPFLEGKDKDPGVVVVDLCSKYAINILSGHLGGGNELTLEVAEVINAEPIVTTATDNLGIIAPDIIAKEYNLVIEDLKKAKYIASLLVDGKKVGIKDDYNSIKITKGYEKIEELKEDCIWITHNLNFNKLDHSKILRLIRKDLVLGIGCRRGTAYEKLEAFISSSLIKYDLDIRAVKYITSVDVKKYEEGIIKLSERLDCQFKTFEREEIKTVQDKYEKSEFVLKTLGITGVCEPCVDLMGAKVIISKIKHEGMTLAIGTL